MSITTIGWFNSLFFGFKLMDGGMDERKKGKTVIEKKQYLRE